MSIFTKSLVVPSTLVLSLVAVIGTAQAQQTRKIDIVPGNQVALAAPQANIQADAPPADVVADASQAGVDPRDVNALAETAPSLAGPSPQNTDSKVWISEEAKRLNRQRYVERYQARQYEEPRYEQRYVHSHYAQPRYAQYVEPRYAAPRYQAAPSYGYAKRTTEYCPPKRYGY